MPRISVLVVDDSASMRKLLTEILSADPQIEVVDAVSNALDARRKIKELNPDVLTLDVEMPGMNGISFLERVMALRPMPVVMISAMTERGADTTMKALMLGAIDFVGKPQLKNQDDVDNYAEMVCRKVKAASYAKMPKARGLVDRLRSVTRDNTESRPLYRDTVIGIGASTGGVEAIYSLLSRLPRQLPPIMIAQHIPPIFSTSFARRLNEQVGMRVFEAADGQRLEAGAVYIAPGDKHLSLSKQGTNRVCRLSDGPKVNRHIPSVDVLFYSLAVQQPDAVGVLLTGMGEDGARGLLEMRAAGANTIAQDEKSSVVWGMPGAAVSLDAAEHVLPLPRIADRIVALLQDGVATYNKERITR